MHTSFDGVSPHRGRTPPVEVQYSQHSPESGVDAREDKKETLFARYNRRHGRPDTDYNIYGGIATSVYPNIQKDLGKHWIFEGEFS